MSRDPDDDLAVKLRALGHPARLAILRALARADRCQCGEIVRGLPLAQSTVSQHLKVLKQAGLIAGTIEGPRSCYCLDREGLAVLADALGGLMAELSDGARRPAVRPDALAPEPRAPISTPTSGPPAA